MDAGVPFDGGSADAGPTDAGRPDAGRPDAGLRAPQPWPRETAPLTHDVDRDLSAVLETANLQGACQAVAAGATDRLTRLRCGKWMFFYESFDTLGAPAPLLDFLQKHFADTYYGRGFERFGFIPDPASTKGMPLGLVDSPTKLGSVESRAFGCASCHFGKLPDGRYAVGYANQQLDYSRFIAGMGAPLSLSLDANDPKVHPTLRAELAGPVATAKAKSGYSIEVGVTGLQLLGAGNQTLLDVEEQGRFLHAPTGTMDFLTKPLVDDKVWTVSRILSLWNIPEGTPHEWLSWNGGVPSLEVFISGFITFGGAPDESKWPASRYAPLAEYIRTLRAPPLETTLGDTSEGAELFVAKGCMGCHDGRSGESTRVLRFDEVGTDDVYADIYAPDAGAPCCGFRADAVFITEGIKAPRMTGLSYQTRFLHTGTLSSLEELFCLVPRPMVTFPALATTGHQMTCEGLEASEKVALIRYLRSL